MAARSPRDELMAKPMAEIRNLVRGHAKLNGTKASLVDEILRLGLYTPPTSRVSLRSPQSSPFRTPPRMSSSSSSDSDFLEPLTLMSPHTFYNSPRLASPARSHPQPPVQVAGLQLYRVTILHNKHVSGYQFYFDAIGIGEARGSYKFNPEWNYNIEVEASSPAVALRAVFLTNPFLAYVACKYREISMAEDFLIDPKKILSSTELLRNYYQIESVEALSEELYEENRANEIFALTLNQPEIRAMFTPNQLLLLETYAQDYIRWRVLAEKVSYYDAYRPGSDNSHLLELTLAEWDRLIYIELTYGSIEVHPVI